MSKNKENLSNVSPKRQNAAQSQHQQYLTKQSSLAPTPKSIQCAVIGSSNLPEVSADLHTNLLFPKANNNYQFEYQLTQPSQFSDEEMLQSQPQ